MLHQEKSDLSSKQKIAVAIGDEPTAFSSKLKDLQEIWSKFAKIDGDGIELRLISKIIFHKTTPINVAIISDNLEYFKQYVDPSKDSLYKSLQLACLCGSQKIGESLLETLKINLADEDNDFILSYVSSSMNHNWSIKLAKKIREVSSEIPRGVYLFCHNAKTLSDIKKIFDTENKSLPHPSTFRPTF